MSTEPTTRSRRASHRSNETADQSSSLSLSLVGAIRKSRGRPSLGSISTASSASSKLSDTFDVEKSIPLHPESPTTPTCETLPPPENATAPEIHIIGQRIDSLSHPEPKGRRKRAQEDESHPQSPGSADTPLRIPRKRSSARKSRLSDVGQPDAPVPRSHLFPGSNAKKTQRASSAPTPHSTREESVDVDRLPVPGRYDSQNSNPDVESNFDTEQLPRSIALHESKTDNEPSESSFLEIHDSDHEMEDSSDLLSNASTIAHNECYTGDASDLPPSPFIPYTCLKGRPRMRRVRGELSLNGDILELIQKRREKGHELGWVYVAESEEHGPEKLKIGKSKRTPDKRIEKLQECQLELKEIPQKYQNPFYHFHFVEKVVHLQLGDQRLKLICQHPNGGKKHELVEWFDLDRKKALEVVETWRNWLLIQEPLDSEGRLTPYWQWRAQEIEAVIANVDWQSWTQPPKWHFYKFVVKAHFAGSRKDLSFWVVSAIVTLLSFVGHGGKGAVFAVVALLLL